MSALLSASFFVYKERRRITRLCLSCAEWCLGLSQGGGKRCLSPYTTAESGPEGLTQPALPLLQQESS